MITYTSIHNELLELADGTQKSCAQYFKTGPGEYAEHDCFIGIKVPILRKLSKSYMNAPLTVVKKLLSSRIHEERQLALFILVLQYQGSDDATQELIVRFYLENRAYVNNWDLVDCSAPYILGAHWIDRAKSPLQALACSDVLWDRRIAIVSTAAFIKNGKFEWTFKLSKILLNDKEDLIHKAVGWMLREVGIRDQAALTEFLDAYAKIMPRTMLRYSIEKFCPETRTHYLNKK